APVASRREEVLVSGDSLVVGGRAVSVDVPRVGPHLEEAEVLAVVRARLEPGLAPRDLYRLVAVAIERVADRRLRRQLLERPVLTCLDHLTEPDDSLLGLGETNGGVSDRDVGEVSVVPREERRMVLEEAQDALLFADDS